MNTDSLNIDIYRLAGVNSMIGIEFTETGVRILELAKSGNPFNKYKGRFFVKSSIEHEFSSDESSESKGANLRSILDEHGIKTTKVVVGVPSQSAKTVEAEISPTPDKISDWISEHQDDILKLPIPPNQLTYSFQTIDSNNQGVKVRITFIRTVILEEIKKVAELAGLEIIGIHVSGNPDARPAILDQISNLDTGYRACAGLALTGFFPEIDKVDFLPETETNAFETKIYKSLFQRAVIAIGAALILLLFVPFALSQYLEIREANLEEKLISVGPIYSEVRLLERQVQELEQQLSGGEKSIQRSDIARTLFDLANSSPGDLWFSKLAVSNDGQDVQSVTITGYAKGSEAISEFMRTIRERGISRDVSLVRSGTLQDRAQGIQVRNIPASFIGFELTIVLLNDV